MTLSEPVSSSFPMAMSTCHVGVEKTPWVPLGAGKWFRPLRFLPRDSGFVELLKLEPGVEISWHSHTGEVHAYNVQGKRELHTGERIEKGDYVFERSGQRDRWKAVGDEPVVVFVLVLGEVLYLGPTGEVLARFSASSLRDEYENYCRGNDIEILNLND